MAKKVASALEVDKAKLTKQHKRKNKKNYCGVLLKEVIDYLKSDCYMFAPLFSSPDFFLPKLITSISSEATDLYFAGVDPEVPFEEEKDKNLAAKVEEYLKTDCYMYAPLLLHQPSLSSHNKEASPQIGQKKVVAATTPATEKATKKRKQLANKLGQRNETDNHNPAGIVVRHTVSYRQEAVQQVVRQQCCSSSATGGELEKKGSRNVVVE